MASKALFYFDNLTEKGTLAATSTDPLYHVDNLQDRDKKTYWKPSTTAAQQITLTLPSAMSADAVDIINDNLYTKGYGLKVYGADDAGFTQNVVYAVGSAGAYHPATAADQPIWHERYAAALNKRYRRYAFGPLGTGSSDVLVADICEWPEVDTLRHPGGTWMHGTEDDTQIQHGRGFQFATTGAPPPDVFGVEFKAVPFALWSAILAGFAICRTGFLPFVYIDEFGKVNHVRFTAMPRMTHDFGALCDFTIEMRREP